MVRAVHRDGVPDELRRLRTRHTLRFQFGVDIPDGAYVRAWLPAEAEIEYTGAREISVVAPFMRDGDHLIRRANHPVFGEHRQKLVVRAVEILYACDEAVRIVAGYEPPDEPAVEVIPRFAVGHGATEAPRGMLYHRFAIDDEGTILDARIVPPTSQNQLAIEEDLRRVVEQYKELADDDLRLRCEQAIRNHDPCISCATHFLDLTVNRT